ncbi:MAG: putative glycosyltransferase [Candidatus Peregrinibacteria bacterium Greene0416_19]|nr:MAG: putative glycosyltransferase [Candidatus Peregrinibacteria bacterium Greene0416_19]
MPLVSAIILNYRTGRLAVRCAEALLRQTIGGQLEVIIIDNHSDDDSIGFIRNRFRGNPSVRIVETRRNIGYGRGNAEGIRFASGTYLLIINPDNELEPDGLERMVAAMEADPEIGILGPQLRHQDGSIRDSTRAFPTMTDIFLKRTFLRHLFPHRVHQYLHHLEDPRKVRGVDWVAGACLLIRRDFFGELGGFDPRFFLFFEDTDLCRRCWRAGRRVVYFPLAKATDRKHRLSEGGLLTFFTKKTVRIHLVSALKYFWKWKHAPLTPH